MSNRGDLYSKEATLIQESERALADGDIKDPIEKLRLHCFTRGLTGILHLSRTFRIKHDDGNKAIYLDEFTNGIQETGIKCTDEEIQQMFERCDTDRSGTLNVPEFLTQLRPPMPQNRVLIINKAFEKMDTTGDGVLTLKDIKHVYSVKEHPKYQSGEMSAHEILTGFLHNFEGEDGDRDGKVTREEFMNYYASVSASVDEDGYFDLMMRQIFNL